ncbi:primosomal protein DnaI [Vaginisenegalia massiliensis]|uniref:primosomal protein DnaI n=1 Tax=Vaginisenegalia massiliensis TaxID=2058294 RepID=UPI000F5297E3|nr:primosomal protein DnaI [Vaginisenegalia massiliensis]
MKTMRELMANLSAQPNYQASLERTYQEVRDYPEVQSFIHQHADQLSSQMITNSLSKLNEYVREMKAIKEGRPGQNPGFVPHLFINQGYIDITYVPTQAYLDQEAKRKRQSLMDNRMMAQDVRLAQLDQFDLSSANRQRLFDEVLNFIQAYEENPRQAKGLFITGPFGVGKTYLLGAMANLLVDKGIGVTMLHYPSFASEIKASIANNTTLDMVNQIKNVPVLIIDDIGAESNSAWLRDEVLTVLLEHRMKESLATFFTSNFNMAEIEHHLATTRDAVERVKAKRLMERFYYLAKEMTFNGENRRRQATN